MTIITRRRLAQTAGAVAVSAPFVRPSAAQTRTVTVARAAPPPAPLPRLLVVSADPDVRARVEDALHGKVEVHAVGSADEALVLTSAGRVDGALVDARLPDLPGVELVRLLRAEPESLAMPLAVCGDSAAAGTGTGTAADAYTDADAAREAGADVRLDKPLRAEDLLERVLPLLSRGA